MASLRPLAALTAHSSAHSAELVFGSEPSVRRGPPLSKEKSLSAFAYCMEHLGFVIDTRKMTVSWPVPRRLELRDLIMTLGFQRTDQKRGSAWYTPDVVTTTPHAIATILGKIRSAAAVTPLGVQRSLRLQHLLNASVAASSGRSRQRRWWRTRSVHLPVSILSELRDILNTLDENPNHPAWTRPLGCLVSRDPTHIALSDASQDGMGGYCPNSSWMWRLSRIDLLNTGFDIRLLDQQSFSEPGDTGLHINVLELVAMIINLWMLLKRALVEPIRTGGLVLLLRGDNTSAISWFAHAARSHSPAVQRLTRLATALLVSHTVPSQITTNHIPGWQNTGADALSRPTQYPTWASVIEQCSELADCKAYRLPRRLLSLLSSLISSTSTEVEFEQEMTELWKVEVTSLPLGVNGMASTTSLSQRSRRKRSRR